MKNRRKMTKAALVIGLLILIVPGFAVAQQGNIQIKVKCEKGQSVQKALDSITGPSTIVVSGMCNENVVIKVDDVTIVADPLGGTINGADPDENTILVNAFRTVIDGLTVTGGRNGITIVGSSTVRNCAVQNVDRIGISFYHGSRGSVDNCTVQNNGRHGIHIEGGGATVTNSRISSNAGVGVVVVRSGSARIGIADRAAYAGNIISNNQSNGIEIADGGSAAIGGNTITGNGTNLSAVWGRYGVAVFWATGTLVGKNSISGNAGSGVLVQSSNVTIGDPGWGLEYTGAFKNSITGNGTAGPNPNFTIGGVQGYIGASLSIRGAQIDNNTGDGVTLRLRSTARMYDVTVNNNTGNGILLRYGGGLRLQTPAVTVTGNTYYGLQCDDAESSYTGDTTGISGNYPSIPGNPQVNCTGF